MSIFGDLDKSDKVQALHLSLLGDAITDAERDYLVDFANLDTPQALKALTNAYIASDTFQDTYAASSDTAFVRSVFFNLFDRNATRAEVDKWTTKLENGMDDAKVLNKILDKASESDLEAFNSKLFISNYVTDQEAAGNWVPDELTTPALRSNAQLYAELTALDAESDDIALGQIGSSVNGNPLYAATAGTGETEIVFMTQQHGDEPIGTEAALLFLDFLASDSADAEFIRDNVTITVVPRVNPDGFARWEREVGGERGVLDPRVNEYGIDLNRTHDPEDPYSEQFAPESAAINDLIDEIDPSLFFDYHGQGNYRGDDGRLDSMSVLWPTNEGVDPAITADAQRAVAVIADSLAEYETAKVSVYPGGDEARIGRNGFSLEGVPTVLVEQRFSQELTELARGLDKDYSALVSALALEGFITMKAVAQSVADGSFASVDPTDVADIPDRSPSISYDDLYGDDDYVGDALFV